MDKLTRSIERRIVGKLVTALLHGGNRLSVSLKREYDPNDMLLGSRDKAAILKAIFSGNEGYVFVHEASGPLITVPRDLLISFRWVRLRNGNGANTDGCGPINGSMEFTREFPVPPINKEAAELIDSLGQRIAQLETALAQTVLGCQNLSNAHWDQHDRLRSIVEEAVTFLPFRKTDPDEAEDHEDLPEAQRAP